MDLQVECRERAMIRNVVERIQSMRKVKNDKNSYRRLSQGLGTHIASKKIRSIEAAIYEQTDHLND